MRILKLADSAQGMRQMQVRVGMAVGVFLTLMIQFHLGVLDQAINQMVKADVLQGEFWLLGIIYDWVGGNEAASTMRNGKPLGFFLMSIGFSSAIALVSYAALSILHNLFNLGAPQPPDASDEAPVVDAEAPRSA